MINLRKKVLRELLGDQVKVLVVLVDRGEVLLEVLGDQEEVLLEAQVDRAEAPLEVLVDRVGALGTQAEILVLVDRVDIPAGLVLRVDREALVVLELCGSSPLLLEVELQQLQPHHLFSPRASKSQNLALETHAVQTRRYFPEDSKLPRR